MTQEVSYWILAVAVLANGVAYIWRRNAGREEKVNHTEAPSQDPVAAYLNAHFRPDVAADLLAAAQPLMAIAWDEGEAAGFQNAGAEQWGYDQKFNPYRKASK